jgi:threonine 3-dehydrogenase
MKALVKTGKAPGIELKDVEIPDIGSSDALIKVKAATICGSDIHIYKSSPGYMRSVTVPLIIGHEACGEVVEVGERVINLKKGDTVSLEPHLFCGHCYYCQTGNAHHCRNRELLGISTNGVFAEYARVPAVNCWKHQEPVPSDLGAIYEPLGVAVHGVLAEEINGRSVAIFGCGPIGLFAIGASRAFGAARIFALEVSPKRLTMAGQLFPDVTLINPGEQNAVKSIMGATDDLGVDVSIEVSGSAEAATQGLKILKRGGRLSLVGVASKPIEFDTHLDIIRKEARMLGVLGHIIWKTWWQVKELLGTGKFDPLPVITHRFPLNDFEKAFALAASGESGKILLYL